MNESIELIKKNGIRKCCKKDIGYFTQFTTCEKIDIPCEKPSIEQIVSVIADTEIISTRIVNTPKGTSIEGQQLTGKKLCIELKLNQKLMYVSNSQSQSIHAVENTSYCSAFIIIPECIDGSNPENLLAHNLLQIDIFVEDIAVQKVNSRQVEKHIHLLVQAEVASTYKLCITEEINCTKSNLFILYPDGTCKRQLTEYKDSKVFFPEWSPSGQSIAFLLKHEDCCSLCYIPAKGGEVKHITDQYIFPFISSYCWSVSNMIYFASYIENNKEIYSINPSTLEWKQLTYGNSSCKSYKPKCSPDGTKIAFLKSVCDKVNLYIMNNDGLSTRQLTSEGYIKDFYWSKDCTNIICVAAKDGIYFNNKNKDNYVLEDKLKGDGIIQVDIANCRVNVVLVPECALRIRKLQYSPDNKYISFIGKSVYCEDIYIYDILKCQLVNLTNHNNDIEISDSTWNAYSDSIYFSANDLLYFNLYHISLCNKIKTQISNTTADGMQTSYRPKLV